MANSLLQPENVWICKGMNFYSLFPFVLLLSYVELPDSLGLAFYFSVNFLSETKLDLFFFFFFDCKCFQEYSKKFYLINDLDILPKYLIIMN